jgi:hypothetical protein
MGFSKSETAKQLGISSSELEKRARKAGYKKTGDYVAANGGVAGLITKKFKDSITKQIVEIDRQLDSFGVVGLTQEEKDTFLQKAIADIQPYYDSETEKIQQGLREGRIQSAEDALTTIRTVEEQTANTLAKYDLSTSQTEEELIQRLGDITSTANEDVQMKTMQWRDRIESTKLNQIQQGSFQTGMDAQKRQELATQQQLDIGQTERKAQVAATAEQTNAKYTLQGIQLARESAQQLRERQIGAPAQTEAQKQAALGTLGYTDMSQLPNATALEAQRNARGYTPISQAQGTEKLANLAQQKTVDTLSTQQEFEKQRLAEQQATIDAQKKKLLSEKASKSLQLGNYAGGY